MYNVTVTLGNNGGMCNGVSEDDRMVTTQPEVATTTITGLEEFRNYRVTITATFSSEFGLTSPSVINSDTMNFTTAMACESSW